MAVREETIGAPARGGLRPEALAQRFGIHYAWVVIALTLSVVVTASGVRAIPGVIIHPLEDEFSWNRSDVSLVIAISLVFYGLAAPLSGRIGERFGLRAVVIGFLLVSGVGLVLSTMVQHLWQLHLFWGFVVGVGTGGVATVMGATVANTWFESKRGMVTGLTGGAASAGQLVFVPALVFITAAFGWRVSIGVVAVLVLAVVLPFALVFMRSRPRDVGIEPYGVGQRGVAAVTDDRYTPLREAVRTGDFWLLCCTFFVCGFTSVGLIGSHFIAHATEHGFTDAQAAGIFSTIGAMNIFGTIGAGILCDRYSARHLLAGFYIMRALTLLALPFIDTLPLMGVFALLFGLDYIATVPPTVMLTADRFGRRSVGTIYGWITFVHMIGAAVASYFAGYVHDALGEYTVAMYVAGILGLMAAMLAFGINSGQKTRVPKPATAG
jgi:sugar phosphate permease